MSKLLIGNILDREDMIMTEWKKIKVSDIGNVITGKTPKTSNTSYYGGHIPFLTPSDDMSKKYVKETKKYITEEGRRSVKNSTLPANAICVSCIGSDLGKVMITTEETVTNQQINSIIVDEEKYDVDYIYYLMLELGKILNFHSKTSTAVPIINKSTFSQYELICPSLNIQKKIGSLLSTIDLKIELNLKINNNLEQQVLTLYQHNFIDTINELRKKCKMEEYFDVSIGKTPPRKEPRWFSNNLQDITWISISDMGNSGLYISNSSEQLTREAIEHHNIKIVPDNTVLLSFKLTVGRVAITDGEVTTNEAIAHFKTNQKEINEYLYCYLKHFKFETMGSTSSIAIAINSKIIKSMLFIVPTDVELDNFHNTVAPMFRKIKDNLIEISNLTYLRDTLLPKLMSGEVDVSEIDI